jgi:predicted nucleic acid-binding Zn ribbon protein
MPTYVYRCECGNTTEERKPGRDRYDEPTCACGKRMKLTIGAPTLAASRQTEGKA